MKFKKQFKEAYPETIGETDSHFDESNYIDWIDKEYTQLKADKEELLQALEKANDAIKECDWSENEGSPHLIPIYEHNQSLIQKMKQ